jgi:hypothetical protein
VEVRYESNAGSAEWFLISCREARTNCRGTAEQLCPGGYFVVNAVGDEIATLGGPPEVQNAELRVRCVPSFVRGR